MTVTELAIKRPILFIVFFLTLAGLGLFSYSQLKYELLPDISTPIVTIFTTYPGASPKEVESTVTRKIEESIAGVSRIKRVTSSSAESFSTVMVEFVADADESQAVQDLQRAISRALPELPAEVKAPVIEKFSVSDAPVLRLGVTAKIPAEQLYTLVNEQIKPRLAQLKGAGRVTLLGGSEREVQVLVNDGKLKHHQVSLMQVVGALGKANVDVPVGNIKDTDASLGVRVPGKVTDFSTVENLVIALKEDGSFVRLQDVARVVDAAKDVTVINRIDQRPSLGINLQKQSGANAVEVVALAKAEMAKIEQDYQSAGLRFLIAQDSSEFTLHAAQTVYKDFFIAIGLVALVMLVFLHSLRNSLIVMLAIPTSLVSAFIMMYAMDYSLNMMTLLAMSLVIGILVDDSIVVLENIYRHLEMGKDKRTASLDGRNEIGFAALSITLVDVVVFLPMALVPGLVGSIVKEFSLVIVVSTLSSLVVSFTLTPMIASRFARLEHLNAGSLMGRTGLFFEKNINRLTDWYQSVLVWSLRHRIATVAVSVGLLIASLALVVLGYVGAEFAPVTDKGEMALAITMPPGTRLEETNRVVRRIEQRLNSMPEISRVFTNVGMQTGDFSETTSPEVAELSITAVPAEQRSQTISQLSRQVKLIALQEPGAKVRVSPIGIFGASGAPIQLLLSGSNRDSVLNAANQVLDVIRPLPGIVTPRLSAQLGKPEVEVNVDRQKAAELGLDIESIGTTLRTAINGYGEMKFREENTEVDMRIVLAEDDRSRTDKLLDLSLINDRGQLVYLKQFATVNLASGPSVLERRNRSNSVVVLAQVVGRPTGDVGEDIRQALAGKSLPAGVRISYEGDLELQDDAFGALGLALIASITLVYLIMVALYNSWVYPFVVLFSIPVAVVGAFLALALTAKSLNIFSIFGMLMMIGLVAKNAILLVDRANEVRAEGRNVLYALIDAGRTRLRPILMTTLAMVIGMLPLALSSGAGSELNSPLAWVLVGGLSSSMFLTLVLVPVIYLMVARVQERIRRKGRPTPENRQPVAAGTVATLAKPGAYGVALLLISGAAFGQVQPLSVEEAVQMGLHENPQVKIALLEEQKSVQKTREAASYRLPSLTASGQYVRNIKPAVFFFPQINIDPATGEFNFGDGLTPVEATLKNGYNGYLDLQLPLLNGAVYAGVRAAKDARQVSRAQTAATRQQLASDIRKAYYQVLIADENRKLIRQSIQRSELSLAETRSLLAKGMASDADTLRAYVATENLRPDLLKAENGVEAAKAQLKNLIGLDAGAAIELTDSLTFRPKPVADAGQAYQEALAARPDLQQLVWQQRATQAQTQVERNKVLPTLSLIGQYQIQSQANDFRFDNYQWPQNYFMGLQLSVPLFAGFRNLATLQQAKLTEQQTAQQMVQLKRQIATEVQVSQANLTEAQRRVDGQSRTIQSAERSYQLTRSRYRSGLMKFSELADAELALNQAKANYLQAVYDYLIARTELARVLGK